SDESGIGHVGGAMRGVRRAVVADDDSDRVAAFLGVGVSARDLEDLGGRVVGDGGAGVEGGAVAPVDARRVIRSGPVGVGVGEAVAQAAERRSLRRRYTLVFRSESGIGHVGGAVRGVRRAVVADDDSDRVAAFLGIGVGATDVETAPIGGDGAARAV